MPDRATVYDPLRRKHVALTPEEGVRQRFVNYLITQLGYPAAMMANEVGIRLNGMLRRCDTVVYNRVGLKPLMIIEYKAPDVKLTQGVVNQVARYNLTLNVAWLVITNGIDCYCFNARGETVSELPSYEQLTQQSTAGL